jgi:hypothetical protein
MLYLETGGRSALSDAIKYVHKIFETQEFFGQIALKFLKPIDISEVDYIIFNICFKMVRLGKSAENIFDLLDSSGDGNITIDEFTSGVVDNLKLWFAPNELESVF